MDGIAYFNGFQRTITIEPRLFIEPIGFSVHHDGIRRFSRDPAFERSRERISGPIDSISREGISIQRIAHAVARDLIIPIQIIGRILKRIGDSVISVHIDIAGNRLFVLICTFGFLSTRRNRDRHSTR